MDLNYATWIPSQADGNEKAKEWAPENEYGSGRGRGIFQELCLFLNRAESEQDHYLAPNLSSGTALKGCLCLGLMQKAQDAMSEGNNQHGPFITLATCAPGQGPRLISVEMKSMTSPSVKLRAGNSPVTPTGLQASCDPFRKVTFTLLWRRERERCGHFQPMWNEEMWGGENEVKISYDSCSAPLQLLQKKGHAATSF